MGMLQRAYQDLGNLLDENTLIPIMISIELIQKTAEILMDKAAIEIPAKRRFKLENVSDQSK